MPNNRRGHGRKDEEVHEKLDALLELVSSGNGRMERLEGKFDSFKHHVKSDVQKERATMTKVTDALARLEASAARDEAADNSAKTVLTQISAMLKEAVNTNDDGEALSAKINEIAEGIENRAQSLADAVVANTPAANPAPAPTGSSEGGAVEESTT